MKLLPHSHTFKCRADDFDPTSSYCWGHMATDANARCARNATRFLEDGSGWCCTHSPEGVRRRIGVKGPIEPVQTVSVLGLRVTRTRSEAAAWPQETWAHVLWDASQAFPLWAFRLNGDVVEAWSTVGMRHGWLAVKVPLD